MSGPRAGACGGLAAVLASFSLLLQAVLPLMPAVPSAHEAGVPNWTMASLCLTRDAPVPDRRGAPAGHESDQGSTSCPICLGLHLASIYVPPALAIPLPALVQDIRAAPRSGVAPAASRRAAFTARGPPIAA